MKYLLGTILIFGTLLLSGCGNLSPRINEEIDNQNGQIDEIRHNQNGIMTEIGKLRQEANIAAEKLENFQQGLINLNSKLSSNENYGIQILQGDGALMLIFGLGTIFLVMAFHYKDKAKKAEKTADIFAQAVIRQNNINLEENILSRAMNTEVEVETLNLLKKHQKKAGIVR